MLHCIRPVKERARCSKVVGFFVVVVLVVVCERYTERFCVRNGAKLSGWIADIQSGVQSDNSGKFQ